MTDRIRPRIGVLGGTFDPIHLGHLKLASIALKQLELERVYIIPAGNSYFKSDVTPFAHRAKMVALSIEDMKDERLFLSDLESDEVNPAYTYLTLQKLKDNTDSRAYFICGADILGSICTWKEPGRIFENADLAVAIRPGGYTEKIKENEEKIKELYPYAVIDHLDMDECDISSTAIKANLRSGLPVDGMLCPSVFEYIKNEGLYGTK